MKKILVMAAMVAAMMVGQVNAGLIAYWNFNNFETTATTIAADQGSGSISLANWNGSVANFAGSTINAQGGDPAGASLSLVSQEGNGSYIQISFSMAGLQDLDVMFAARGTATGFDSGTWSYSTDGTNFTTFGTNTATRSTSFALATVGTTSGLDNAATAFLRYTLSGATSDSGNNRIDNLVLSATAIPEPSALLLVGSIIGAGVLRRRRS